MPSKHTQSIAHYARHYLTGPIQDGDKVSDLIEDLKIATPNDTVHIYLNSPGGSIFTTMQVINSIRDCQGMVITQADGDVSSAASLIFFSASSMYVSDFSTFLIHNGDMMLRGKHSDTLMQATAMKNTVEKLFRSVYYPFLSTEEIDSVLAGRDIHLESEQVCERIKKVLEKEEHENTIQQQTEEDAERTKKVPRKKKSTGRSNSRASK